MSTAAVVPAAGFGERLGPGPPKALRLLAGVPMLVHAVTALVGASSVKLVVVAAPPLQVDAVRQMLAEYGLAALPARLIVVAGAATRAESVRAALSSLPPEYDVVLVHDAARPLVPVALVEAVTAEVRRGASAVVPALPVADTIRRVDDVGRALGTVDRASLRAVQTPQGFARSALQAAYDAAQRDPGFDFARVTDDAALVEACGGPVQVVAGAEEAFKVTRPLDLLLAEAVLARRAPHD